MLSRFLIAASILAPTPALAFDTESWTNDPSVFGDLAVEDFQWMSPGYTSAYTESSPLVVGDLAYWGAVWPDNGWCIPTMDSNPSCGGTNRYLASAVDLSIEPLVPVDRIGFRFGSQGHYFHFEVELSDGSTRTFSIDEGEWGGQATGFFGYGTGDASLTITRIHLSAADGGIDDIRYGLVATTGTCDDLDAAIRDLALHRGLENSLLTKVEAADRAIERGQTRASIGILEALVHELSAQRSKAITAEDADELIACVEARIASL